MKTLIIAILLFISVNCYSQFNIATLFGQGIKINSGMDFTMYQTTVNVMPTYSFGKFSLSEINSSVITDSTTEFFIGFAPAYEVYRKENNSFGISAIGMLGDAGKSALGGGLNFSNQKISLGLQYLYESKLRENWVQAVLGVTIYRD